MTVKCIIGRRNYDSRRNDIYLAWGGNSLQRLKSFFQPKVLRLLALGLILIASLLLLIQDNYGNQRLAALVKMSGDPDAKSVEVEVLATYPQDPVKLVTVHASKLMISRIAKYESDQEFLVVIHERDDYFFERIYPLATPASASLQGPNFGAGRQFRFAVGSKPELVAMIGLDRFGYQLDQPLWAKLKMPGTDMVYSQTGTLDAAKDILDGESDAFPPDVYYLDNQDRIVGLRQITGRIITFPEFMRLAAMWLYAAALLAGLGSVISYKWSAISRAGRRIWDHVSMRGRKASS